MCAVVRGVVARAYAACVSFFVVVSIGRVSDWVKKK